MKRIRILSFIVIFAALATLDPAPARGEFPCAICVSECTQMIAQCHNECGASTVPDACVPGACYLPGGGTGALLYCGHFN